MASRTDFEKYLDDIIIYVIITEFSGVMALSESSINFHITNNLLGHDFPFSEIQASFDRISKKGLLSILSDPFTPNYFSSTLSLMEHYDDEKANEGSVIWKCININNWIKQALHGMVDAHEASFNENIAPVEDSEYSPLTSMQKNNSSDKWEPLSIDESSIEYQEAISELENVLEVVRSNNGYAETEPDERDEMVWSLETGLEAIQDPKASKEGIKALLVRPLKYLSQKFTDAAIGVAAKNAVTALIKLLTDLF